uniref:Uncharacterized protein n=1 Tax=Cucumis melo TaxID=3656 RepID=A0A9I9E4J1_CUCME
MLNRVPSNPNPTPFTSVSKSQFQGTIMSIYKKKQYIMLGPTPLTTGKKQTDQNRRLLFQRLRPPMY